MDVLSFFLKLVIHQGYKITHGQLKYELSHYRDSIGYRGSHRSHLTLTYGTKDSYLPNITPYRYLNDK